MDNTMITAGNSALPAELKTYIDQTMRLMQGMADMIRTTNERMTALEQQVRMLEKVTPSQAAELNAKIRARAQVICRLYRLVGDEKPVSSAIRKAVRLMTGARSVRDIARCDYKPVQEMIDHWDEYHTMMTIRKKEVHK